MSCKINKNPQGKIIGVQDQNGNDSTLFREIISNPHIDTNQAVEIYKETYSDKIKTEEESIIDNTKEKGTYLKAPNGEDTNLSPEQWVQVRTKAFKNWFGDWENNPSEASKVIDENGEPLVVYHGSTSYDIEEFNRERSTRLSSGLKEFGTYFTTNLNIANIYKNSRVSKETEEDRKKTVQKLEEALNQARSNKEYDEIRNLIQSVKEGKIYAVFLNLRKVKEFNANFEQDVEAWNNLKVQASYKLAQNRDAIEFLKDGRFGVEKVDGIIGRDSLEMSTGSSKKPSQEVIDKYGGDVYLVFDTTKGAIKSAEDNIGTFNPETNNIMYSLEEKNEDETIQEYLEILNQYRKDKSSLAHSFENGKITEEEYESEKKILNKKLSQEQKRLDMNNKKAGIESRTKKWDTETKENLPNSKFKNKASFEKTLKQGSWGMLTGENPNASIVTDLDNQKRNSIALDWLIKRGYEPQPIFGKYGNSENSFFVENLTVEDAIDFANIFGQESVTTDKGLIYQDGTTNPIEKDSAEVGGTFEDFYSTIKINGEKINFRVNYNFEKSITLSTSTKEPSLTYTTPINEEYSTFKEALQNTQTGEIQAKVGNVVLFSVDSSTDYNTYNGTLNGLIKSGILSGESVLEPTGEKVILTEGGHNIIKTINAVIAKEALIKAVGRKNVKETLDSNFILENKEGKVTLKNSEGENIDFDKTTLDDSSLDELQKQFPETYMEIVAMQEYKKLFKGFSEQSSEIEEIEFTPENELQSALIELLNKMGVKITSITDYITKFAKKNGVEPSASALADLTNKIVAFKDGEITTEDLSEEVAHFIVETFNEQEIENLLRNIHRTEEWQQHAENYFNIYRKNNPNISEVELERLVRKEILGKVLANSFVNGFNTEGKSETQGNIIQRILDLFNKFIEKITARFKDSYAVELENWTNQVNANLLSGELYDQLDMSQLEKGRFKMYSASNQTSDPIVQINIRANKALNVLQSNMNNLREGGSKSELEQYRASLEKRDELSKLSAVSGIIGVVKRQTAYLKKAIEKNKDKNYPLSQEENSVFINTTGTMLGYMTEIKNLLDPNNKEHKRLIQEIDNLNKDILDIKGDKNILSDSAWKNMVERVAKKLSLTEEQKQTLLDAYIERVDENGNKIGGKGKKDTNWFFAHISSMVHAQDPALNMASDVISRMTMKHGVNTYNRVKNLFDKWEKLGITQPNKLLKKWKRGSYIMNPIRQDILDKEVLDKKTTLYNSIKGTSLTNEEFDKLEREDNLELTTEERLDFYEDIYEYRRKEHNVDYLTKEAREKRERMYDGLSKEAIRFDKNLSRERGQIGEEARKLDEYTQEHKYRLQQINKKRQRAKSPYNNEGQLKQGLIEIKGEIYKDPKIKNLNKDAQMVVDLIELDKRKLEFFKEKNKEEKIIPEKFKKLLKDRLPETQLEYLLLNANISFSNEFWETLSEKDSFVDKLEKIESTSETVELINRIKSLQKRRNTILKANKVHNMPSEIDFSEMDGSDIEAVKDLSEQLQNAYKEAKLLLKESSEETDLVFSSVVNKAYLNELEAHGDNNSKEQEFEFIKDHVTTENKRSLNRTQVVAEDIISGRKDKLSDFYKTIFQEEYIGTEEEIREEVYNDLVEHAKGKLLPYFKRIEPNQGQSFTSLMEMLESGQKTPLQFIEEIENNLHPQIQVTPNYIFFEDTENQDLNPEYKRNEELGLPQIQEKYRDSEYENYFGISSYGGQVTKNIEEHQALQALMEFHEETMEATGMTKRHNKYLLPQKGVRGARQIHKLFSQDNKLSTLKEIIKDATSFREDEKQYGENVSGQTLGAKDGDLRIPKYGFNKLENQDDVTDELLESYIWMGSEAELYKARVEAFADMEAIKNLIANNTYSGKEGESSRIYKMFDSFYRFNIYGQNEEFSYETDFFGMLPKKYNIAPLAKKFQFWVRLVNLGFNLIVPLTSIFQGGVNLTIERFVGERIDKDASKLARRELRKLLTEAVGDTLALNSKSRLNSIGEFLGVFDIDNRFKNSNYNRLSRGMLKTGFITHTLADAPIKAQVTMSVLKDMRVVNGDILNFNQFMAQKKATLSKGESLNKKAIRTEWRKYEDKTFDKYLTTHNGITELEKEKLYEDLDNELTSVEFDDFVDNKIQFARDTIKRTAQEIDTMIPAEEKSFAQRHAIFSFFFLHRGWMSVAYNRKFKSRHINTHTGLTEEGNWWGTSDFIKQWINEWRNPENSKTFLKTVKDMWDNADDTTRRSINRTLIELAVTNSLAVLSLIMMGLADDQDDDAWMAQFSAYMGYRVSNEVISSTVAYPRQIGEFIESPIVGWDKLKGLSDMFDLLDGDIVERGKYKGETEKMRFIYKSLPAFKEYYNVKNAHDTRNTYEFYNTQNFNWAWSSYLIGQNQE